MDWLAILNREVVACTRCPRLVVYREQIAREKKRAYRDWEYWGKPVPGFGDPKARVLIMGLAPGAHGFSVEVPQAASRPSAKAPTSRPNM